jgi:hypothetical protein
MAAAVADKARQMLEDASRFLFFDADGKVLAASWEVRHRLCVCVGGGMGAVHCASV